MMISLVPSPANLFQPAPAAAPAPTVFPPTPSVIRPEQLLRALVVARQADTPILEMAGERFQAVSPKSLQVGQVLDLRIVQTGGRIEALVLNNVLQERLAKRLPLLTRPYDWHGLLERLQQPTSAPPLRPVQTQQLQQLQQLLAPTGRDVAQLGRQLEQAAAQLRPFVRSPGLPLAVSAPAGQQRSESIPMASNDAGPFSRAPAPAEGNRVQVAVPGTVSAEAKSLETLFGKLQQQVTLLLEQGAREPSRTWQRSTTDLLIQVREQLERPLPPGLRLPEWTQALQQLQQHPQAPPHIATEAGRLLAQLNQQATLQAVTGSASTLVPEVRQALASLQQLVQEVKTLQAPTDGVADKAVADGFKPLPPALLGRIEGVTQLLQQLQQREGMSATLQEAISTITTQLHQLATAPTLPARGEALGLLSQFFGLHLERELLYDKQKTALNNLKRSLLALQQSAADDVREPLQRIELFQLAKARFGEMQMLFLPLPFSDLEEGFLLAQRQENEPGRDGQGDGTYQLSLSLRLSALGNMRVDMHFDRHQGVTINLACDDRDKVDFMKVHAQELKDGLSSVRLRDLSYSIDAAHPVQLLRQRLLPQQDSLLDTRI